MQRSTLVLLGAAAAAAAVGVALAFATMRGGGGGMGDGVPEHGDEPGPIHVHGLGLNPADGALVIATHTGTWRLPSGSRRTERLGESRQDTMGFTVVGPDRFLGSGHPDPRDALPPLLGLMRSDDGGRSWQSVSLLGEADFHVLRAVAGRVYGVDAAGGRLLASADGGRTWSRRALPDRLLDLAPHPRRPGRLVAATEAGIAASGDDGRSWRQRAAGAAGLLAWPRPDALLLVGLDGRVARSADGGTTWRAGPALGGEPAAFAAAGRQLWVALHDGRILHSRDLGRSWRTIVDT